LTFEFLVDRISDEGDQDMSFNAAAAAMIHRPNPQIRLRYPEGSLNLPQLAVVFDHIVGG